ncbi:glycoside hydrolase family 30 protein [Pseudoduganella aquatica]|uniref:Glycosyl hydrolase n=1 Tax=Pseudoduganella aquatica TaxID=2660641 RepID=A0A7X4HFU8_9BURK|nr:glycoside hydrolase family 30 beta sandwich domain-containing protein [Pseudoduganella aquatica]MYN09677.1 glycosyl hydrolase [Pseudoduganella aquatica]
MARRAAPALIAAAVLALSGCAGGLGGLPGAQRPEPKAAAPTAAAPPAAVSPAAKASAVRAAAPVAVDAVSGAAAVPPQSTIDQPAPGMVASWLTTGDQSRLLQRQPDIALGAAPRALTPWSPGVETAGPLPASPLVITVDRSARRQRMSGFGAAISASSAWLLTEKLDPAQRKALLAELFGPPPGIALSVARLPLGANEFALGRYSYNDLPPGQTDDGLAQFSIDPDRAHLLPLLQEALAYNPELELIASPASAPGWMKTSGSLLQGTLKPEAFDAYARYLKRYVDVYLEEGIPIHAITVQNEPSAEPADAPGMRLDDAARAQLIGKHLGPLLEDEGPLILDWDGNRDTPQAPLKVLADKAAGQYVAGVAWHCYAGDVGAQAAVAAAHPGQDSYITECSGGAWAPAWSDNLTHFARTLVQGAARGAAKGIMLGNLALDGQGGPRIGGCRGCRGVVTVGEGGVVTRNPEYYALAHASRFARAGAWRIASGAAKDGVDSAAFDNPDGTLALIAVNSAAEPRTFTIQAAALAFTATLPPASVATYVWRPAATPAAPRDGP